MPFTNVAFQSIIYHNTTYKYNTDMLYYKGIKVFVADKVQLNRIPYLAIKLFIAILSIYPQNTIKYNRGIAERQGQNWYWPISYLQSRFRFLSLSPNCLRHENLISFLAEEIGVFSVSTRNS